MSGKKPVQLAEEDQATPAEGRTDGTGVLARPLPRWVLWLLVLGLVTFVVTVVPYFGVLHVYEKHLRSDAPHAQVGFDGLLAEMDEAAFRRYFKGVPLNCITEHDEGGRRVCYAALRSANGMPALTLAAFFHGGRLSLAFLHVPWWAHGRTRETLQAQWGPGAVRSQDTTGKRLREWSLPNGRIAMNENRYAHPLQWSAVVWEPKR